MSNPDEFSSTFSSAVNHANTLKRAIQGCAWGEYTKEVSSYPDLLDALDARRERYSEAAQKLSRRKDRMTQKRYDAEEQRRQAEGKIKQEEFEAREKIRQEEFRAAQKRYQQEIKECERIAEQQKEHRKQTPSARSPYVVAIMPAGEKGEYRVDERVSGNILKTDWLHYAQSIDPQNADISQVERRMDGPMVAFKM